MKDSTWGKIKKIRPEELSDIPELFELDLDKIAELSHKIANYDKQ